MVVRNLPANCQCATRTATWSLRTGIVGKVWRMLFLLTGGGTHQFQIAFGRLQYRVKTRVLDDIRPPFTLLFFQFSIDSIFIF